MNAAAANHLMKIGVSFERQGSGAHEQMRVGQANTAPACGFNYLARPLHVNVERHEVGWHMADLKSIPKPSFRVIELSLSFHFPSSH